MLIFFLQILTSSEISYELSIDQETITFHGDTDELTQNDVEKSKVYLKYVRAIISRGITSIGVGAFTNCGKLESVDMSGTVKILKKEGFKGCSSLKDIVLPEGVVEIQENCFTDSGITSISLPSSLETIYLNPFSNTPNLKKFNIEFNSKYSSMDNGKYLVQDRVILIASTAYQDMVVPPQIEVLSSKSFSGNSVIRTLTFAEKTNLTEIKDSVFRSTTISQMVIPEGTRVLGGSIFDRCSITELWLPSTLTTVSSNFLKDCSTIKSIHVPSNCSGVRGDELGNVYNSDQTVILFMKPGIGTLNISETLRSILVTSLTLNTNLTKLRVDGNNEEFYEYNNTLYKKKTKELYAIIGGALVVEVDPECQSIGHSSFKDTRVKIVRFLGTKVKSISGCAFEGLKLESMQFPEGLESMSVYIFSGTVLGNLTFPSTFKTFTDSSMRGSKIPFIDLSSCVGLTELPENSFYGCSVEELRLPPSLKNIRSRALYGCKSLRSVRLPVSLELIDSEGFKGSALEEVEFDDGSNVTLKRGCFSGNSFRSLSLPDRIKEISENAFEGCGELIEVSFDEGSLLESVGPFAFKGCQNLTRINFGSNLRRIEGCALSGAVGLKNVTFPETNEFYCSDGGVIYNKERTTLVVCLSGIESIEIDWKVREIAGSAFYKCSRLQRVSFGDESGVASIGSSTFYGCVGLRELALPKNLTSVPESCFSGCGLVEVIFVEGIKIESIDKDAFSGCPIRSVDLRGCDRLELIGNSTFEGCQNLTDVLLPSTVTSIGSKCFSNCPSLHRIEFCSSRSSSLSADPCSADSLSGNSGKNIVIYVGIEYNPQTLCGVSVQRMLDDDCNMPSVGFSAMNINHQGLAEIIINCIGTGGEGETE